MKRLLFPLITVSLFISNTSFIVATSGNKYSVMIIKSRHELRLYDSVSGSWLATYPAVFGNNDLGDKMMQGDRKTPEGIFHITYKRVHEKWDRFMAIDYPNKESYEKFNRRKEQGLIPIDAKIGGDIGIHGTWPNEDFAIDQVQNWTEGCISTKNKYVQELFDLLPLGTRVEIRH